MILQILFLKQCEIRKEAIDMKGFLEHYRSRNIRAGRESHNLFFECDVEYLSVRTWIGRVS